MGALIALTAGGCGAGWLLASLPPLSLTGRARIRHFAAFVAANLWVCVADCLRAETVGDHIGRLVLVNLLAVMSATDVKEKAVYDVHAWALAGAGIFAAFFRLGTAFWTRTLFAVVIYGVLWLIARKRAGVGMADLRIIATLALWFPVPEWMEATFLALALALLCGAAILLLKKGTLETELSFIPFLLAGVLLEIALRGAH